MSTTMKLDTPKRRLLFAIACLWFIGVAAFGVIEEGVNIRSVQKLVNFLAGLFLVGVLPILLVWGVASGISRLVRWIKSGT